MLGKLGSQLSRAAYLTFTVAATVGWAWLLFVGLEWVLGV
jgi:hypothetical protein